MIEICTTILVVCITVFVAVVVIFSVCAMGCAMYRYFK
jgi:hypothetical protein